MTRQFHRENRSKNGNISRNFSYCVDSNQCFYLGLCHLLLALELLHPLHHPALLLLQNVRGFVGQFQAEEGTGEERSLWESWHCITDRNRNDR